jgi:hypothetical protein
MKLDKIVRINSGISARRALKKMNGLRVTARTIRNYLTRLGWRTVRTKYCQFVSEKNRHERFFIFLLNEIAERLAFILM